MSYLLVLLFFACSTFAELENGIQYIDLRSVEILNPEVDSEDVSGFKYSRNAETNSYFIYTRLNPTSAQRLVLDDVNSITSSNFNVKNDTVVVIHGWADNSKSVFNLAVRDAYLQKSDVNVIIVDWSSLAKGPYGSAVAGVTFAGRGIGHFLSFLTRVTGASFESMHLIGFSLGAHVAGNAGRTLGGRVARITGLDPAGPLWYGNSNCLNSTDAVYVEAIHMDGKLGIGSAVGDADFFPNGGRRQPGCPDPFCNHNRAWQLFAATVTFNHLVANQCANMAQVNTNSCRGSQLHMGNDLLTKKGSGLYRVNTKAAYPF